MRLMLCSCQICGTPARDTARATYNEAGYEIVYASGRHHLNIARLGLGELGWLVSSQGTVARHFPSGEVVFESTLDQADVLELEAMARDRGLGAIAYHRDAVHVERVTAWTELYAKSAGWSPLVGPFRDLPAIGFQKVLLTTEPERVMAMHREPCFARYHAVITEPSLLELLPPGTNKATAAEAVARRLGLTAEDAVAFGDGNNDVEMLAWAGNSYAMPHGREAARRAAKHVCPPGPPETAFARAVDHALLPSSA